MRETNQPDAHHRRLPLRLAELASVEERVDAAAAAIAGEESARLRQEPRVVHVLARRVGETQLWALLPHGAAEQH